MNNQSYDDTLTWPEIVDIILRENEAEDDKKFKEWLMSKEGIGYNFSFRMWRAAYNVYKKLNDDYDHFTVIVGREGKGKSTLGLKFCAAVSPTFSLKHICFSMEDFIQGLREAKPGDSFLLDEGALFLFSREAMSDTNRIMLKIFSIMRAKNLHVCICIPNFFTIDSYVRDHRVNSLFFVNDRGKLTVYVDKAIRIISKEGSRFKQVLGIRVPHGTFFYADFNSRFPVINDITGESYRRFKAENIDRFLAEAEKEANDLVKTKSLITVAEYGKMISMERRTIIKNIEKGILKGRRIGKKWFVDASEVGTDQTA